MSSSSSPSSPSPSCAPAATASRAGAPGGRAPSPSPPPAAVHAPLLSTPDTSTAGNDATPPPPYAWVLDSKGTLASPPAQRGACVARAKRSTFLRKFWPSSSGATASKAARTPNYVLLSLPLLLFCPMCGVPCLLFGLQARTAARRGLVEVARAKNDAAFVCVCSALVYLLLVMLLLLVWVLSVAPPPPPAAQPPAAAAAAAAAVAAAATGPTAAADRHSFEQLLRAHNSTQAHASARGDMRDMQRQRTSR